MTNHVLRAGSRAGLVLAGLCLLSPFLTASCTGPEQPRVQWEVTWTGADMLTGGRPDIAFTQDADENPMRRLDADGVQKLLGTQAPPLPSQPLAWLAVALMVASLAASALPSHIWRPAFTAGFAAAAAVVLTGATILARTDALTEVTAVLGQTVGGEHQDQIQKTFSFAYGYWLAILTLSAVATAGIIDLLRRRDPG